MTPRLGTDGIGIVYPLRGIVQVARRFFASPQGRAVAYVAALAFGATFTAVVLVATGSGLHAPLTVIALATTAALAERASVRVSTTDEYSISLLPTLFAAVLFGPLEAGIVGAASMLGDPELIAPRNRERMPRLKWATYTSTRFMCGVAMGIAASKTLDLMSSGFGGLIAATLIGAVVGETLDVLFAALTSKVRGRRMRDAFETVTPIVLLVGTGIRPRDRGACTRVSGSVSLDTRAIPRSHSRSATPLRPLPRAAATRV